MHRNMSFDSVYLLMVFWPAGEKDTNALILDAVRTEYQPPTTSEIETCTQEIQNFLRFPQKENARMHFQRVLYAASVESIFCHSYLSTDVSSYAERWLSFYKKYVYEFWKNPQLCFPSRREGNFIYPAPVQRPSNDKAHKNQGKCSLLCSSGNVLNSLLWMWDIMRSENGQMIPDWLTTEMQKSLAERFLLREKILTAAQRVNQQAGLDIAIPNWECPKWR